MKMESSGSFALASRFVKRSWKGGGELGVAAYQGTIRRGMQAPNLTIANAGSICLAFSAAR